jgi:hypothetical protein
LSGAFLIDQAFDTHMAEKTKLRLSSLDQADYNLFVWEDWELGAKRAFSGSPTPEYFYLRPPAKAFKKLDRWRGKDKFALNR